MWMTKTQSKTTYRRYIGKIPRAHYTTLFAVPELQEALGHHKNIVGFFVVVESRRIGENSAALEN